MRFRLLAVAVFLLSLCAFKQDNNLQPGSPQLMQPEELAKLINSGEAQRPIILYVGPHTFYAQAHIAGAEYIGQAGKPEGMEKLRLRAKSLRQDAFVVIYCGCCPWDHCPNIRPAYQELQKIGFTRLRVLYLATSFGTDWQAKNYPVAKGD